MESLSCRSADCDHRDSLCNSLIYLSLSHRFPRARSSKLSQIDSGTLNGPGSFEGRTWIPFSNFLGQCVHVVAGYRGMQRSLHTGLIKIRDISVAGSNVRTAGFAIRGPPPGWNKTGHRGGCTRLSRTILYYDLATGPRDRHASNSCYYFYVRDAGRLAFYRSRCAVPRQC